MIVRFSEGSTATSLSTRLLKKQVMLLYSAGCPSAIVLESS